MRIDFSRPRASSERAALPHSCMGARVGPALSAADAPANPQLSNWSACACRESRRSSCSSCSRCRPGALAGAGRPLNNLELKSSTSARHRLATVGVSQTLDWHDKQGARQRIADASLVTTRTELTAARERIASGIARGARCLSGRADAGGVGGTSDDASTAFLRTGAATRACGGSWHYGGATRAAGACGREIAAAGHQVALAGRLTPHSAHRNFTHPDVALPVVPAENLPVAGSAHDLAQRSPEAASRRLRHRQPI